MRSLTRQQHSVIIDIYTVCIYTVCIYISNLHTCAHSFERGIISTYGTYRMPAPHLAHPNTAPLPIAIFPPLLSVCCLRANRLPRRPSACPTYLASPAQPSLRPLVHASFPPAAPGRGASDRVAERSALFFFLSFFLPQDRTRRTPPIDSAPTRTNPARENYCNGSVRLPARPPARPPSWDWLAAAGIAVLGAFRSGST